MLKNLTNFITFKAFKPDKEDSCVPLMERFIGDSLLMLYSFRNGYELYSVNVSKHGKITCNTLEKKTFDDPKDSFEAILESLRGRKEEYISMTIVDYLEVFPLSAKNMKSSMRADKLSEDDRAVLLGAFYEKEKKYLFLPGKDNTYGHALSYNRQCIEDLMAICAQANKKIARISCPFSAILQDLMHSENGLFYVIIYLKGNLVVAEKTLEGWGDISFRNSLDELGVEAVLDGLIGSWDKGKKLVFLVNDSELELRNLIGAEYEVRMPFEDIFAAPVTITFTH